MENRQELKEIYDKYVDYYRHHHRIKYRLFITFLIVQPLILLILSNIRQDILDLYVLVSSIGIFVSILLYFVNLSMDDRIKTMKYEIVRIESALYSNIKIDKKEVVGTYREDLIFNNEQRTKQPLFFIDSLINVTYIVFVITQIIVLLTYVT